MTQIPWCSDKLLVWDVTVVNTLTQSYVCTIVRGRGKVAELAADIVRKVGLPRNFHDIRVLPNRCRDPGPDEWVCVPLLWRPWHENLRRDWWHSQSFFHFPAALTLSHHSTLQCSSLSWDIRSARRFGPLAILHFFTNLRINPGIYTTGVKNNNTKICKAHIKSAQCT